MVIYTHTRTNPLHPVLKGQHISGFIKETLLWVHHHQGHIYSLNLRNRNVRTLKSSFYRVKKYFIV